MLDSISAYHHLLLAVVNDEAAGYVYYEQNEDLKQGDILLLHIRSDKRGRGYGALLLNSAIAALLKDNAEEIFINVRVNNYGAQKLYRRIGFTEKETIYAYKKALDNQV